MEAVLGLIAFSAMIGAQFLAVICVHNERARNQANGRRPTFEDGRVWSMWLHG